MSRLNLLSCVAIAIVIAGLYFDVQPRYAAPGAILGPSAHNPVLGALEYRSELHRLAHEARQRQAEIDALLMR